MIQRALLCNASAYFTKALEAGFKETDERILTLPGCDLQSVQLFIYWLCKHDIPDLIAEANTTIPKSPERRDFITSCQEALVRLWCFADCFLIPRLQNVAMKQVLYLLRTYYIRAEVLDLAFRLTSENAPLRTVVTRNFLYNKPSSSQTNAYGGLLYEKADIRHLGSTPGLLPEIITLISKSVCQKLPCTCGKLCYFIEEAEDSKFMVTE